MCRVFSCVVGKGYFLWPVCSPGKTLSPFALLHSGLQCQICLWLQVFPDFLLLHSSPLWFKGMGIPDHQACLLRNLYAGQEATVRTGHGTTDWLQIGKGVHEGCILSPCLFNLYGLWRSLSIEEFMLLNCGVGEDSWESLGLQGDPTSPFWRRSALGFLYKEWC